MAAFDNILFVSRDKIDVSFGGNIFSFPFTPGIVKDLEIANLDSFKSDLSAFLDKNQITFGSCAILLSETVCFISEESVDAQKSEEALSTFQSTIPFDIPAARILGDKIVGTNRALYQTILEVISQKGGRVRMVSPIFLSKEMYGRKGLDEEVIKYVSDNEEEYIKATFTYDAPTPAQVTVQPQMQTQKRTRREFILLGIFLALAVILAVILIAR